MPNSFRIITQHTPSYNRGMSRLLFAACVCLAGVLAVLAQRSATRPADIPFEKHTLDLGANESCAIADINGDGRPDIVSGENWYEAPRWIKHKFRSLPYSNNYIDNFSDLPLDVNGDGRVDIVSCSWFAHRLFWSENPGPGGGEWKGHMIETGSPVEFAFLVDLDNDGKAHEVLPEFGDVNMPLAWYEVKNGEFVKHIVSPKSWGHGIGVGDVNVFRWISGIVPWCRLQVLPCERMDVRVYVVSGPVRNSRADRHGIEPVAASGDERRDVTALAPAHRTHARSSNKGCRAAPFQGSYWTVMFSYLKVYFQVA